VMKELLAAGADWAAECDWDEISTATRPLHCAAHGGRVEAVDGGTIRLVPDAEACRPALRCAC